MADSGSPGEDYAVIFSPGGSGSSNPPAAHSLLYSALRNALIAKLGARGEQHDSPAISPPPYCTEFEYGDFLAPGPRRQYVVVLRNGPLRSRCYYLTGLYLLFICPTCLVIALELQSHPGPVAAGPLWLSLVRP